TCACDYFSVSLLSRIIVPSRKSRELILGPPRPTAPRLMQNRILLFSVFQLILSRCSANRSMSLRVPALFFGPQPQLPAVTSSPTRERTKHAALTPSAKAPTTIGAAGDAKLLLNHSIN